VRLAMFPVVKSGIDSGLAYLVAGLEHVDTFFGSRTVRPKDTRVKLTGKWAASPARLPPCKPQGCPRAALSERESSRDGRCRGWDHSAPGRQPAERLPTACWCASLGSLPTWGLAGRPGGVASRDRARERSARNHSVKLVFHSVTSRFARRTKRTAVAIACRRARPRRFFTGKEGPMPWRARASAGGAATRTTSAARGANALAEGRSCAIAERSVWVMVKLLRW
jgi:hypothetical protein